MCARRNSRDDRPGRIESALVRVQRRAAYPAPELPRRRPILCKELECDEPNRIPGLGASAGVQYGFHGQPLFESGDGRTGTGMGYARFVGWTDTNFAGNRIPI